MPTTYGKFSLEIEVEVSGNVVPYRPARPPSYSSGGDPPEGGYVEDVDINDIGVVGRVVAADGSMEWNTVSILKGVDQKNPEVIKLLSNLLSLIQEDAECSLQNEYDATAE